MEPNYSLHEPSDYIKNMEEIAGMSYCTMLERLGELENIARREMLTRSSSFNPHDPEPRHLGMVNKYIQKVYGIADDPFSGRRKEDTMRKILLEGASELRMLQSTQKSEKTA